MVTQAVEQIASIAIEWLLERIANAAGAALSPRQLILPPRLIVAESCADLRTAM